MKVPPKRKGNTAGAAVGSAGFSASMKVPPKRKGNLVLDEVVFDLVRSLNESPSEKEGKCL